MTREPRNIGASVRARLLDRARAERADFQNLLTRYALERLLYRLSVSPERDRFILKGAMLFAVWLKDPFRPTGDLDVLGHGDDDAPAMAATFREVCSIAVPDDGVTFDVSGLSAVPIREGAHYGGVRIRTTAAIAGARVPIQIDVGFGDAVTPEAVEIDYPTLLGGPAPRLKAYPTETVVAEKFEALVSLGIANTRMKDFYDLWLISRAFDFEAAGLAEAVRRTFERRRTDRPDGVPTGLSDAFAAEKSAQWRTFLTRDRVAGAPDDFLGIVTNLRAFLMPLLETQDGAMRWVAGGPWDRARELG